MSIKDQKKEIETIKPREIRLELSDADCERVFELCGRYNISVPHLLENFLGDLVDGTYSNGSNERIYARQWFECCWFGIFSEKTLLMWLLEESIDVEGFLELVDDIENGYGTLGDYQKDLSVFDEEYIEYLKMDIADWEKQLADYKSRFLKEKPEADWEEEIEAVKKWFIDKEEMVQCVVEEKSSI